MGRDVAEADSGVRFNLGFGGVSNHTVRRHVGDVFVFFKDTVQRPDDLTY